MMKKLILALCAGVIGFAAYSEDKTAAQSENKPVATTTTVAMPPEKAFWPVWCAFNSTDNIDVAGVRFTIPYGNCESVTGFDLGFFGRTRYMEGVQLNILRNDCKDIMAGIQIGLYNSAGQGEAVGFQIGLFNEAHSISGFQVGIINLADMVDGIQIGLINRAETGCYQVGGVNVMRESDHPFFPIVNVNLGMFND